MTTHFVTVKSLESYPTSKWKARTETDQTDTVQASKKSRRSDLFSNIIKVVFICFTDVYL